MVASARFGALRTTVIALLSEAPSALPVSVRVPFLSAEGRDGGGRARELELHVSPDASRTYTAVRNGTRALTGNAAAPQPQQHHHCGPHLGASADAPSSTICC